MGDNIDTLLRAGFYEQAIGREMKITSVIEVNIMQIGEYINELTGPKQGSLEQTAMFGMIKRLHASIEKVHKLLNYGPEMDFKIKFSS